MLLCDIIFQLQRALKTPNLGWISGPSSWHPARDLSGCPETSTRLPHSLALPCQSASHAPKPRQPSKHPQPLSPWPSCLAGSQQAHVGDTFYGGTCSRLLWLRNVASQEDRDRGHVCVCATARVYVCRCGQANVSTCCNVPCAQCVPACVLTYTSLHMCMHACARVSGVLCSPQLSV